LCKFGTNAAALTRDSLCDCCTSFSIAKYQCFFKVFERVSWWSFRVSTPFSLLCLILLTHFHESASFRPSMLNRLNTTFTFGKQTNKRQFHKQEGSMWACTLIHLLIFAPAIPFGRDVGAAALGGSKIPRDQQKSQIVLLAPHQDGTKQGRRCSYATWSLDKLWTAFP